MQEGDAMGVMKLIDRLSSAGGVISGICILLMSGLILLEIVLRLLTGASILICEEYSAYLLVAFGSMALAYTFKSEGHIRVDLILSKLSPRRRETVDLLCGAVGFLVFIYMAFQAWGQVQGLLSERGDVHVLFEDPPLGAPGLHLRRRRPDGPSASVHDGNALPAPVQGRPGKGRRRGSVPGSAIA